MSRVWLPAKGQAWPWAIGLVLFIVLSFSGVPTFIGLQKYAELTGSPQKFVSLGFLLLAFAGALLWNILRAQFLSAAQMRRPFFGTFVMLALAHLLPAAFVLGAPLSKAFYVGAAAVTATVMASALWKIDDPNFGPLRVARATALALATKICEGQHTPSDSEKKTMDVALGQIVALVPTALLRARTDRETTVLNKWSSGANRLLRRMKDLSASDLPGLACAEVLDSVEALKVDH